MLFNDASDEVLIESDWNLKIMPTPLMCANPAVLIESDWNLKHHKRKGDRKMKEY